MPDIPLLGGSQKVETAGAATADSGATSITAGNSNSKGSYVELIASTARDAAWIGVSLYCSYNSPVELLVDIAVGAATEEVIIGDLILSYRNYSCIYALFPCHIPAGTRIAARAQNNSPTGTITVEAVVYLFGSVPGASAPFDKVVTLGANTADSGGTSIDPGGSANTKGSYVEISSSTPASINWLYVGIGAQANSVRTDATWLIDIAIGSATEEVVIANFLVSCNSSWDNITPQMAGPFPVYFPAGTRVAARAQCNITDATDRTIDLVLYGA